MKDNLIKLYKDNNVYIAQLKWGFLKGDKIKHVSPKFFYALEL